MKIKITKQLAKANCSPPIGAEKRSWNMNLGYYSLSVVSAKYRDLFEKGRKNGEI